MQNKIVTLTSEEGSETHCISFEMGKTICGIEYLSSAEDIEISYPKGGIKKVTCVYCQLLIKHIKSLR